MKDLQPIKAIAEQMLALNVELLRLVDMDEQERRSYLEQLKKTPTEIFYYSRACRRREKSKTIKML